MNKNLRAYFYDFMTTYKVYIGLLMLCAVIASVVSVGVNYQIKEIIDAIAYKKDIQVHYLLGLFAFFKLSEHLMFFFWRCLDIVYAGHVMIQTVEDMYRMSLGHSLHWFDSHLSASVVNKITGFQKGVSDSIRDGFFALNNIATMCISLWYLFGINIVAALVCLVFMLIYIPTLSLLMHKQMKMQKLYVETEQETSGIVNDSISNVFVVKTIGNATTELKGRIKPALKEWANALIKMYRYDAFYIDNADTVLITAMSVMQVYYLIGHFHQGLITAGEFTFIAMSTLNIHSQITSLMNKVLFSINPSIARIIASYNYIHGNIDVVDKKGAKVLKNVQGAIEYRDVSFCYPKSTKNVLSRFSLQVKPGEKIGIVGLSGAGKSTIVKVLLRYFDISHGSICIDGHSIQDITQQSLHEAVSIIPQDISMFHRSIKDNLRIAKEDVTDEMIVEACRKANIHEEIMATDSGYDTVVGERGVKLSGGQRQRIAIARAILKAAPVLILDEATSSLDSVTEDLIQASIHQILEDKKSTVIAIAHRLSTLKHMDRIVVVDQGQIIEQGSHAQLIKKKGGHYKMLWDKQLV